MGVKFLMMLLVIFDDFNVCFIEEFIMGVGIYL